MTSLDVQLLASGALLAYTLATMLSLAIRDLWARWAAFWELERGQAAVEYGLLLVLFGVVLALLLLFGQSLGLLWSDAVNPILEAVR